MCPVFLSIWVTAIDLGQFINTSVIFFKKILFRGKGQNNQPGFLDTIHRKDDLPTYELEISFQKSKKYAVSQGTQDSVFVTKGQVGTIAKRLGNGLYEVFIEDHTVRNVCEDDFVVLNHFTEYIYKVNQTGHLK